MTACQFWYLIRTSQETQPLEWFAIFIHRAIGECASTASSRKRNRRYEALFSIGSVLKSTSFSLKAEARAWAGREEATIYSSAKASGHYMLQDIAEVLDKRKSVTLVFE